MISNTQHSIKIDHKPSMSSDSQPWTEKYRPQYLDQLVQDPILTRILKRMAITQKVPHCKLVGPPGTGKTSAMLAIGREIFGSKFSERVIEYNASDDQGINSVRVKITNRTRLQTTAMTLEDGKDIPGYKIIILDESDFMSGKAQDALRVIIEQYSKIARFCFICNHDSRISDAIQSRCTPIYFQRLSSNLVKDALNTIMDKEQFSLSDEIVDTMTSIVNGDMRRAVVLLQNVKLIVDYHKGYSLPIFQANTSIDMAKLMLSYPCAINSTLTSSDIYDLIGSMSNALMEKILVDIQNAKDLIHILNIVEWIDDQGYPINDILLRISKLLCKQNIDQKSKAAILIYSTQAIRNINNGANGRLQLTYFMSLIWQNSR